jgi:hypothetical protein
MGLSRYGDCRLSESTIYSGLVGELVIDWKAHRCRQPPAAANAELGNMPLFFFDIGDGKELFRDELGTDLADEQTARDDAALTLAEFARERIPDGSADKDISMWVRDETGAPILHLSLCFALRRVQ